MATNNLDLIFERWKASLQSKNRKREFINANFDELFEALRNAGATPEEARTMCPAAIKAHQPTSSTAKFVWNNVRRNPQFAGINENEFIADWNKDIADMATTSMFVFFPISDSGDDDGEPKVHGKMSSREHALQNAHADSFEMVDFEEVDKQDGLLLEEEMLNALGANDE